MSRVTAENRGADGRDNGAPEPAREPLPPERALPAPGGAPRPEEQAGRKSDRSDSADRMDKESGKDDKKEDDKPKKPPLYKRPLFWIIAGSVLVIGLIIGILLWLNMRYKVGTDDAFVSAHNTTVSPRVAGHVDQVLVDDNQDVKKGDLLVVLDDRDFQAALKGTQASLEMAKGQLAQANANIATARAQVAQSIADVNAAQANANQAQSDLDRYLSVQKTDPRAVSKQQVDQANNTQRTTAAQLEASREKQGAAEAQVKVAQAQIVSAEASIDKAESDVENARLQLSYGKIYASEDGQVTNRSVEIGNYITPGQALMAIVPRNVWVTGNYKETQLKGVREGQPVKIHIDEYDMDVEGHVQSIQAGSGAAFSLLPPENATGNYVKVVQRIPVKITFDRLPERRLAPGMSVEPTIDTSP